MGAGWLYYHRYPPKRACADCGKRQYLRRIITASNGEEVWGMFCTCGGRRIKQRGVPPRNQQEV